MTVRDQANADLVKAYTEMFDTPLRVTDTWGTSSGCVQWLISGACRGGRNIEHHTTHHLLNAIGWPLADHMTGLRVGDDQRRMLLLGPYQFDSDDMSALTAFCDTHGLEWHTDTRLDWWHNGVIPILVKAVTP